ncbi:MAG: hypothetical protein PHW82_06505 [Bacteroidales bacterium]|nr:hypothetical protein [Bacteroidales bacterium]
MTTKTKAQALLSKVTIIKGGCYLILAERKETYGDLDYYLYFDLNKGNVASELHLLGSYMAHSHEEIHHIDSEHETKVKEQILERIPVVEIMKIQMLFDENGYARRPKNL